MGEINADKTVAILVGIANYEDPALHRLDGSYENVAGLASFLIDNAGIEVGRIARMFDYKYDEFLEAIENFIEEKDDVENIIFYYAGHAMPASVNNDGSVEYFLSVRDTNTLKDSRKVNCKELFRSLRKNNNANLVAIFDCCFSGNVYDSLPQKANSYVIASSLGNQFSIYPLNERRSTFTNTLLWVLNNGININHPKLSFDQIFKEVAKLLAAEQAPKPVSGGAGEIGDYLFMPNKKNACPETEVRDYAAEVTDLYNAIAEEENSLYKNALKESKPYNKLFESYQPIEEELSKARPEIAGSTEYIKSLVLKRYPIIISYLLKKMLYPDKVAEKQLTEEFYGNLYTHILRLLCFIAIKDLADHKRLQKDYRDLISQIWGPVEGKWYFDVLKKAIVSYSSILQIKEFSKDAPFFKSILYIENKKYKRIGAKEIADIYYKEDVIEQEKAVQNIIKPKEGFDFREAILELVKNLAFLVKYNMIAIKLIKVIRGYFQPVSFTHEISNLYGDCYEDYAHTLITKDRCYHNGTVIILPKTANPEEVLHNEEYINLWPLVIDRNGSNNDATRSPEIHIFHHAQEDSLTFFYRIATDENKMFSEKYNRYNDLIKFPSLAERTAYFEYFKKNIGIEHGELKITQKC